MERLKLLEDVILLASPPSVRGAKQGSREASYVGTLVPTGLQVPKSQLTAVAAGAILSPQGKTRVTALGKEVAEEWLRFHDYRPAVQCLMKALQPPDADPRQWGGFSRENIKSFTEGGQFPRG